MAQTIQIKSALRSRYDSDSWAMLWEVPDGTGMNKSRSADAIAMSLWPSRGLELHGFEIKAIRSDWLKELRDPSKAESICRYCDRWWIAADSGVVKKDELPPTWGLLELRGSGLIQSVAAPKLEPQPINRSFLAGLLRASTKSMAREDRSILAREREKGYEEGRASVAGESQNAKDKLVELQEQIRKFEEASGVRISAWSSVVESGQRVKEILASDAILRNARGELQRIAATAERIAAAARSINLGE